MKRVILLSGKTQLNQELRSLMSLANYQILATTDNGMEALRLIHRFEPDLILMGWNLRGLNASEVLQNLVNQHLCPVIAILAQDEQHALNVVIEEGAHQIVLYPFRALEMMAAIHLAEYRFARESEHIQRLQKLEDELKTRKILFQAMLHLVKERGLDEQSAYAALRNQAMSTRKTLRSVAQDVIKGFWLPDDENIKKEP